MIPSFCDRSFAEVVWRNRINNHKPDLFFLLIPQQCFVHDQRNHKLARFVRYGKIVPPTSSYFNLLKLHFSELEAKKCSKLMNVLRTHLRMRVGGWTVISCTAETFFKYFLQLIFISQKLAFSDCYLRVIQW